MKKMTLRILNASNRSHDHVVDVRAGFRGRVVALLRRATGHRRRCVLPLLARSWKKRADASQHCAALPPQPPGTLVARGPTASAGAGHATQQRTLLVKIALFAVVMSSQY